MTTTTYDNRQYKRSTVATSGRISSPPSYASETLSSKGKYPQQANVAHPRMGITNNSTTVCVIRETRPQPQQAPPTPPSIRNHSRPFSGYNATVPYDADDTASEGSHNSSIPSPAAKERKTCVATDNKNSSACGELGSQYNEYLKSYDEEKEELPTATSLKYQPITVASIRRGETNVPTLAEAKDCFGQPVVSSQPYQQSKEVQDSSHGNNNSHTRKEFSVDQPRVDIEDHRHRRTAEHSSHLIQSATVKVIKHPPVTAPSTQKEETESSYSVNRVQPTHVAVTTNDEAQYSTGPTAPKITPTNLPANEVKDNHTNNQASVLAIQNKEEVCNWLVQNKLSAELYSLLLENEMGDLGSLETACSTMLEDIAKSMKPIEKKKFLKAAKELKGGGLDGFQAEVSTVTTKTTTVSSTVSTVATTTTTKSVSYDASATVVNSKSKHDAEEEPDTRDLEKTLRYTEECSSQPRLQLEIENEIKAIEKIIIMGRSANNKGSSSDAISFSEGALKILLNSREYHQQRAQRIQKLLSSHGLYPTSEKEHYALNASTFTQEERVKAVTAAGKRVGFANIVEFHDNRKINHQPIVVPEVTKNNVIEKAKDEAALEFQRMQEMERIRKMEQEKKEQEAQLANNGGWTCNTCQAVNSKQVGACRVCNMSKPAPVYSYYPVNCYAHYESDDDRYYTTKYGNKAHTSSQTVNNRYDTHYHGARKQNTEGTFYHNCASCKKVFSELVGTLCYACDQINEQQKRVNSQMKKPTAAYQGSTTMIGGGTVSNHSATRDQYQHQVAAKPQKCTCYRTGYISTFWK